MSCELFEAVGFPCGAEAPNRMALAPLTNLQSHRDGRLSDEEHRWLERRARGGFGIVETCAAYVSEEGKAWAGRLGVNRDDRVPALAKLAASITGHGRLALAQLHHGGMRADEAVSGHRPWTAWSSEESSGGPRVGTEQDIYRVIEAFRDAAVRLARAGWSGVELHGAHDYLLCQFLAATNQRPDGWGGALEGRTRLIRETLRAVRAAVPPAFIVGVRLSPENYAKLTGLDLDESLAIARWLVDDGADFIHLSLWDCGVNTAKRPVDHPIPLFRAAVPASVPIVACGKIWTRDDAARVLGLGADIVALGRSAILNPEWPEIVRDASRAPARPPASPEQLAAADVSPAFVTYLRRWKGFVTDPA